MGGPPLVTGAAGFAGSHLVDHLLESSPTVFGWSNPGGQPPTNLDPRVSWRAIDLLDRASVLDNLKELRPSAIYHCAGMADVAGAWNDPERTLRVNVLGTLNVLEGVRGAGLGCAVLVTASALVYRPSLAAVNEDSPIGPSGPYGVSKLAQETLALQPWPFPVLLARPFNHVGPRQSPTYATSSFARQIAEIEARLAPPVITVGNLESRRDMTDVRDTVRAYTAMTSRGTPARPYNVCSGRAYRVQDLLDQLIASAHVRVTVEVDPARKRPVDNPVTLGDASRLTAETGWRPTIPIEQTLADLLDYWRSRTRRATS